MFLGIVKGKVVASRKLDELQGAVFRLVQPVDHKEKPVGGLIVAVDNVSSRVGDLVYLVKGREATIPWPKELAPIDAAIVGIVDGMVLS